MSKNTRQSLLRIVDANANRLIEGVRVCEEICRFHLESPRLFRKGRSLRHSLAEAIHAIPLQHTELLKSRESRRDIGKDAPASRILTLEQLLVINFQRSKEALRVLEECSRIYAPKQTPTWQRLRFATYTFEREAYLELAALHHH